MSRGFELQFLMCPAAVARRRRLPTRAKLLYGAIFSFRKTRGGFCPGLETLAREAGLSRRVATRALADLRDARLVAVFHQGNGRRLDIVPLELLAEPATTGEPVPRVPWGLVAVPTGASVGPAPVGAGRPAPTGAEPKREEAKNQNEKGSTRASATPDLREEAEEATGRPVSPKQAAWLAWAERQSVPREFLLSLARTWGPDEAPWQFAKRVVARWSAERAAAAPARPAPALPAEPPPSAEEVERALAKLRRRPAGDEPGESGKETRS